MPNILQVIKYEGDNDTFIWKHPREDFNLGSQLIVHETQEAIFFKDGQALDLFGPGRYTLTTQNIPLVSSVVKFVTGGDSPFHCEVYFVNKTEQMGIKWGTDSKVNYEDPNFNNYPFPIGASGEMSLRVADSRKLLVKLVGTSTELSQFTLVSYFKAPMMTKIKSYLPKVLKEHAIPVFDIDQHMDDFSNDIKALLTDDFSDYGVEITKFWITSLIKPEEDDTYRRLKTLRGQQMTAVGEANLQQQVDIIHEQTRAQKTVIEAEARAQRRQVEGYTYQQERSYDVAERLASNEGSGNFSSAGIGLGMMGGIAGGLGAAVGGITSDILNPITNQGNAAQSSANNAPDTDGQQQGGSTEQAYQTTPEDSNKGASSEQPDSETQGPVQDARDSSKELDEFQTRLAKLEMLEGKIPDEVYQAKLKEILDSV